MPSREEVKILNYVFPFNKEFPKKKQNRSIKVVSRKATGRSTSLGKKQEDFIEMDPTGTIMQSNLEGKIKNMKRWLKPDHYKLLLGTNE